MEPQQFCLKWNNHQNNLQSVIVDLLSSEAFVDVTLACDGQQLKAHKMILSACSPYFQELLSNTPDTHPIIFFKDVQLAELQALLDFMYQGEVSVDQKRLNSLLKVAENLQIKGLADISYNRDGKCHSSSTSDNHPDSHPYPFIGFDLGHQNLGPKRKRGRPRRLSGCEAIVRPSGLYEANLPESFTLSQEKVKTYFEIIIFELSVF